jgi:hypothetical protein
MPARKSQVCSSELIRSFAGRRISCGSTMLQQSSKK